MGSFLQFIQTHISHVAPILVAGAFALAVMLERYRALYIVYPITNFNSFFDRIRELVLAGDVAEAISLCDRYPGKPAAQIVKRALVRANQPESLIESGLQLALEEANMRIQRRTHFLAMLANVATLLGLFGTIAGLVTSFQAIGTSDAQERAELLALGISQAMYATMLGLGVAIPCMVGFSILMNKTTKLLSEAETSAVQVLDIIKQRYFAAERSAYAPGNQSEKGAA